MRWFQAGVMLLGALMWVAIGMFGGNLANTNDLQWFFVIAGGWNLLLLAVTVLAIVDSRRKIRLQKTQEVATDAIVVKLAAIPFFALNFVALLFLGIFGTGMFLFGGLVLVLVGAIGVGLTYLAILSTSVYSWSAIAQLRRDGILKSWLAVVFALLCLVPLADTAIGILIFGQARRRPTLALVITMLSFGVTIAAVSLALWLYFLGYGLVGFSAGVDGFGWTAIAGLVVLAGAIALSVVLRPSLKRETLRLGRADEIATEVITPEAVLDS